MRNVYCRNKHGINEKLPQPVALIGTSGLQGKHRLT